MSNARTPGPWELEEVVNDSGNIKHLVPVAYIDGELTSLLTTVEHNGANFATVYDDADARLMVEAPALLKALQDLLAAVNVRIDDPRIALFDAARALVAKVRKDPQAFEGLRQAVRDHIAQFVTDGKATQLQTFLRKNAGALPEKQRPGLSSEGQEP